MGGAAQGLWNSHFTTVCPAKYAVVGLNVCTAGFWSCFVLILFYPSLSPLLEWECLSHAIVPWDYVTYFLFLQRFTGFALSLRRLGLLKNTTHVETLRRDYCVSSCTWDSCIGY